MGWKVPDHSAWYRMWTGFFFSAAATAVCVFVSFSCCHRLRYPADYWTEPSFVLHIMGSNGGCDGWWGARGGGLFWLVLDSPLIARALPC